MNFVACYKFSVDPKVGFVELWLNGAKQTFTDGQSRYCTNTLEPGSSRKGRICFENYRATGTMGSSLTVDLDQVRVGSSYSVVSPYLP